uniref:Keratinocyte associated transmembrane protein 2 n=1 Tax=Otolemur garnettii TaxID=30611 RepID=H0XL63_OTOGA
VAVALRRTRSAAGGKALPESGIHVLMGLVQLLLLKLLLTSVAISSGLSLKPNQTRFNSNDSVPNLSAEIQENRLTLPPTTASEKSERAPVSPPPSLPGLFLDGAFDNVYAGVQEDLTLNGSKSASRDMLGNRDYEITGDDLTTSPKDDTVVENEGSMKIGESVKALKSLSLKIGEKNSHFLVYVIIFAFCAAVICVVYYNRRKIFLMMQSRRKWHNTLCPQTVDYHRLEQNVNDAMPSLNVTNDYIF